MPTGKDLFSKAFNRILRRDPAALTARLLDQCAQALSKDEDRLCRMIDDCVKGGADFHARDSFGRTILSMLSYARYAKAVRHAIAAGADVNAEDGGDRWTPLLWSAANCDAQTMRLLLDNGANPAHRTKDNKGAIEIVLDNSDNPARDAVQCLKMLLDQGLALDAAQEKEIYFKKQHLAPAVPDIQNAIDLRRACDKSDKAKIAEVLARGTHPDAGTKYGDNAAIIYPSSYNDVGSMELLIKAGADVNLVSPMVRKTPLMNAATHGSKEACKLLINHDADETITFDAGGLKSTAIDFARQTPGLAEYIEEQVAERAWAAAHPPAPDVTLPNAMTVSKPLELKRGPA